MLHRACQVMYCEHRINNMGSSMFQIMKCNLVYRVTNLIKSLVLIQKFMHAHIGRNLHSNVDGCNIEDSYNLSCMRFHFVIFITLIEICCWFLVVIGLT
jgi:hypothetical protein